MKISIAWPTVGLFFLSVCLFIFSIYGLHTEILNPVLALAFCSVSVFMQFTVAHEASHGQVAPKYKSLNLWLGRIATYFLSPFFGFKAFRYIHLSHHGYTNDPQQDPDYWVAKGSVLTRLFYWLLVDVNYLFFYFKISKNRPSEERLEFGLVLLFTTLFFLLAGFVGLPLSWFLLWFAGARVAILTLAFVFSYLPHHMGQAKFYQGRTDKYRATNIILGKEAILAPILLWQNYHLIHHLWPNMPFYMYRKKWLDSKSRLYEKGISTIDL